MIYNFFHHLICQEAEREGYVHTDACYRTWEELICTHKERMKRRKACRILTRGLLWTN